MELEEILIIFFFLLSELGEKKLKVLNVSMAAQNKEDNLGRNTDEPLSI